MDISLLRPWIPLICFVAGALLVTAFIVSRLLSREPSEVSSIIDDHLDVNNLSASGPGSDGPQLEIYGIPVRLVALVFAPVGRGSEIDIDELPEIVEQLLPGLHDVMGYHQPVFRRWIEQVSVRGFQNAFLSQVNLPGNKGKNSCWSAFAGKFTAGDRTLLAGLLVCADQPNAYGTSIIDHEGRWVDALRVRQVDTK
jgi:hypothetical protein